MTENICKLCDKQRVLKESHVIPKSIYNWIKNTSSTGILRGTKNINKPVQDGFKYYWLCDECEQRFSTSEKYFMENIFKPINNSREIPTKFNYDERLFYFLCSIWWRIIHQSLLDNEVLECKFLNEIKKCESELKLFLNEYIYPLNYDSNYLMLLGEVENAPKEYRDINFFFLRSVDPLLMFDDTSCYLTLRIPHFYFFGNIVGLNDNLLKTIKLSPSCGEYIVDNKPINEPHISSFIPLRIVTFNKSFDGMSSSQITKTTDRHIRNKDKWMNSKSFESWMKDRNREKGNE